MRAKRLLSVLAAIALVAVIQRQASAPTPVGTAFTYQGQLKWAGSPLTGTADFVFTLWDEAGTGSPPAGGSQIGPTVTVSNVSVTSGLFTAQIDFGVGAFNGDARWLQIAVRAPAGGGRFTTLSPRQPVTASPYALKALGLDAWSLDAPDGDPVDAVYVDNDGEVGIGTTDPSERLHVNGNAKIDGQVNVDLHSIVNLADPTNPQDAATKSYVDGGAFPKGGIIMWSGALADIPAGWGLCDGTSGTPDLRDRFILGAAAGQDPGATGGTHSLTLTTDQLPSHNHDLTIYNAGSHGHGASCSTTGNHRHYLSRLVYQPFGAWGDIDGTPSFVSNVVTGYTDYAGDHSHTISIDGAGDHTHSGSIGLTGAGQPVDNRPAYYKLAFIMKL